MRQNPHDKVLTLTIQPFLDHLLILAFDMALYHIAEIQAAQLWQLIKAIEQEDDRFVSQHIHGNLEVPETQVML